MKLIFYPRKVAIFALAFSAWLNFLNAQEDGQAQWTSTGSLLTARVCHTAVLLPNGRALIVGGFGNAGELSSAELYDPKKGAFTHAKDMSTGRCYNTTTLLPNGQVLVVGGQFRGNILSSAELYDPKTNTWKSTDSLHIARAYHTATLLPNGHVLVVGGMCHACPPVFAPGAPAGSALDSAELYDPISGKWTMAKNLHVARFAHSANMLTDGQVLVTGGLGIAGGNSIVASTELYDPDTGAWKLTGDLHTPLFNHFAISLPYGQALVLDGKFTTQSDPATAEIYNPSTEAWSPTGGTHTGTNGPCAILPDGKILVTGGASDSHVLTAAELYDPYTASWEMTGSMKGARCGHTSTLLKDGSVLVTGGLYELGSPTNVVASAELFNPATNPKR